VPGRTTLASTSAPDAWRPTPAVNGTRDRDALFAPGADPELAAKCDRIAGAPLNRRLSYLMVPITSRYDVNMLV